ncbi:bifunctional hydroxymethylpyrimidine kinase/phosphomethylpyrimidine kinase [Streptococcus sciuri]
MSSNILAISGNDIFSGGGLHADLTTFAVNKLHGFLTVSCLTALTSNGFEVIPIEATVVKQQLDSLVNVDFAAIKIGLLPNVDVAEQALHFVQNHKTTPVVLDPVLVCKEKHDLEVSSLRDELVKFFPYVTIVTPNLVEAQLLAQIEIKTTNDIKVAAQHLHELGAHNIIIKGGNRFDDKEAIDLFYDGREFTFLSAPLLDGNNVGAGCTFASSIASQLAQGKSIKEAVRLSKDFVCVAIAHADDYGVNQLF